MFLKLVAHLVLFLLCMFVSIHVTNRTTLVKVQLLKLLTLQLGEQSYSYSCRAWKEVTFLKRSWWQIDAFSQYQSTNWPKLFGLSTKTYESVPKQCSMAKTRSSLFSCYCDDKDYWFCIVIHHSKALWVISPDEVYKVQLRYKVTCIWPFCHNVFNVPLHTIMDSTVNVISHNIILYYIA